LSDQRARLILFLMDSLPENNSMPLTQPKKRKTWIWFLILPVIAITMAAISCTILSTLSGEDSIRTVDAPKTPGQVINDKVAQLGLGDYLLKQEVDCLTQQAPRCEKQIDYYYGYNGTLKSSINSMYSALKNNGWSGSKPPDTALTSLYVAKKEKMDPYVGLFSVTYNLKTDANSLSAVPYYFDSNSVIYNKNATMQKVVASYGSRYGLFFKLTVWIY